MQENPFRFTQDFGGVKPWVQHQCRPVEHGAVEDDIAIDRDLAIESGSRLDLGER